MNIVLVICYLEQSMGLKYLEAALTRAGYSVSVIYFKKLAYTNPLPATERELQLLTDLVNEKKPLAIGFSVMATFFLETVYAMQEALRARCHAPIIWGGAYPTLFPDDCMQHADYVLRGEGEESIVELANALRGAPDALPLSDIQNLTYRQDDGTVVHNDVRPAQPVLDAFGWTPLGLGNKYYIHSDALHHVEPVLMSRFYDTACSRGCPYACAYCSASAIRKFAKGKAIRYRPVQNVIDELIQAKSLMKNITYIRFYDEVFPSNEAWLDEFLSKYKQHINLPFVVWAHPHGVNVNFFKRLVDAGLYYFSMGIQSGSPYVRNKIFNRPESNEDILKANRALVEAGVPEVYYDFILRHPFESHETLRESLELCLQLTGSFELQMHSLAFFPGTPIVQTALDMGLMTPQDMHDHMFAPMQEKTEKFWGNVETDEVSDYLYKLIFLSQVKLFRPTVRRLAAPDAPLQLNKVNRMYTWGKRIVRLRHIYKKLMMHVRGTWRRRFS